MRAEFEIQQVLHGYSDGHRKLASSCRLPKDADRQILILSDLSGPGGGDRFDPYLTGYPVESADFYALARTWPAPEMGRPGCVWTHTLLLRTELLAGLDHPDVLLSLFRRPDRELGFDDYLGPIEPGPAAGLEAYPDRALGPVLIRALYGGDPPCVVLPVARYADAESPFMAIWRVQWPSLRRHFTFCSGSRNRRSLEGEAFHLQAALPRDVRRLGHGPTPPTVVEPDASLRPDEGWIETAADAYVGSDRALLDFFGGPGQSLPGNAALFRPVVSSFLILRDHPADAADLLIRYAAQEYPASDQGRDYKRAFLGDNAASLPEIGLIRAVSLCEVHSAFDPASLRMRDRGSALWSDEDGAWGLMVDLLSNPRNPLGDEAVRGLTSVMPTALLRKAVRSSPEVLIGIIRDRPDLARCEDLWREVERQSFVAGALSDCRVQVAHQAEEIARAALDARADPVCPSLIDVFGWAAIAAALDWLDEDPLRRLPGGWRAALSTQSTELLSWLMEHPSARRETATFILANISLESAITSPRLSMALKNYLAAPVADHATIEIAARVLRESFSNQATNAVELASIVLDTVYRAAADSRLSDSAWYELLPYLPASSWWQSWDRCERLRRGVAEKFRSQEWPANKLTGITSDDRLFAEIVGELRERRSGRHIIAEAIESEDEGIRRELLVSD